ncbi:hypothetical protein AS850_02870 [Frondihabitans sp. 762G35]|uniref:hypothetical protein n=1 Tax=Frondihabitans sp. 762G35 TaxID=1446794 RepID=UPI000D21EC6C|nr:hypothetical protein [Frondihabitans sp. 762G35]ARC56015.1 hypothetical protein AS850_02870 [Frondihabitans sp. 762G35]
MPKQYAQIRPEMWFDDDWRSLTAAAQHLYLVMLSDPALSYAGVAPWHPGRIAQRAKEWSTLDVMKAAVELSYSWFLVFDQDTEEVLVRSYIRHDGLLKQPRLAVSIANAFGAIGSNKLRAAVVHELARLRKENPDLPAWEKPQVKTVLRQNAVNPRDMDPDLELPFGVDLGVHLPQTQVEVSGLSTTATATSTPPTPSPKADAAAEIESYPQGPGRSDTR